MKEYLERVRREEEARRERRVERLNSVAGLVLGFAFTGILLGVWLAL